ncbi:MAG: hypothetical protein N2111_00255 [Candidatus Sumerlaeaceae bacterium]|nr:hypothetical protein [Candidatus Sumerlaeaceae bacterium]
MTVTWGWLPLADAAKPATTDGASTASAGVHAGRLGRVDEAAAIRKHVLGLTAVPDTDVSLGYFLEPAAGVYTMRSGNISWRLPQGGETHYLGITVLGSADQRVVPECKVRACLTSADGKSIGSTVTLSFVWDPVFNHYGANVNLAETSGPLTLSVLVEPPPFARRDKVLGAFFTKPVSFAWQEVQVPLLPAEGATLPEKPEKAVFGPGRYAPLEPTPYPGSAGADMRKK